MSQNNPWSTASNNGLNFLNQSIPTSNTSPNPSTNTNTQQINSNGFDYNTVLKPNITGLQQQQQQQQHTQQSQQSQPQTFLSAAHDRLQHRNEQINDLFHKLTIDSSNLSPSPSTTTSNTGNQSLSVPTLPFANSRKTQSDDNIVSHSSQFAASSLSLSSSTTATTNDGSSPIDATSTISLSLTTNDLSKDEAKTYLRWYNTILTRKGTRTICLDDVFHFLWNFRLPISIKEEIKKIYNKKHSTTNTTTSTSTSNVNIGEFFALLRIIAHAQQGQKITGRLIKLSAPIPTPFSILSRKRLKEDDDSVNTTNNSQPSNNNNTSSTTKPSSISMNGGGAQQQQDTKLDLDSFTQFLLTGERPNDSENSLNSNKKKSNGKRVKFSENLVTFSEPKDPSAPLLLEPQSKVQDEPLDYSLPMEQLLERMKAQQQQQQQQQQPQSQSQQPLQSFPQPDSEELKDVPGSINNFQNVSIDSVSLGGAPATVPSIFVNNNNANNNTNNSQFLNPNMTGQTGYGLSPQGMSPQQGLSPQLTGYGDYQQPQQQQSQQQSQEEPEMKPLEANLTGSVSKSMRNHMQFASLAPSFQISSPIPQSNSPISSNINILSASNLQGIESSSPSPPLASQYEFNSTNRLRSASAPSLNFTNTGMASLSMPLANNNQARVSSPLARTENGSSDTALQFLEDALSTGPQQQQQQQQQQQTPQQQQQQQFLNPGNTPTMTHNNSWSGYSQAPTPPVQRQQSPQIHSPIPPPAPASRPASNSISAPGLRPPPPPRRRTSSNSPAPAPILPPKPQMPTSHNFAPFQNSSLNSSGSDLLADLNSFHPPGQPQPQTQTHPLAQQQFQQSQPQFQQQQFQQQHLQPQQQQQQQHQQFMYQQQQQQPPPPQQHYQQQPQYQHYAQNRF
ncbi:hypothetical protein B5S28_g3475 [[Candida] boidinii]|nr:hypothetical protein B5S28_g3475 [[Candida] boidinii]